MSSSCRVFALLPFPRGVLSWAIRVPLFLSALWRRLLFSMAPIECSAAQGRLSAGRILLAMVAMPSSLLCAILMRSSIRASRPTSALDAMLLHSLPSWRVVMGRLRCSHLVSNRPTDDFPSAAGCALRCCSSDGACRGPQSPGAPSYVLSSSN